MSDLGCAPEITGLGDCPPSVLIWATRAWCVGVRAGREQLLTELSGSGDTAAIELRRSVKQPTYAHFKSAAKCAFNLEPCRAQCGRCASCVCAEARARRGGRDYLGADREAELASAGAA